MSDGTKDTQKLGTGLFDHCDHFITRGSGPFTSRFTAANGQFSYGQFACNNTRVGGKGKGESKITIKITSKGLVTIMQIDGYQKRS